MSLLFVDQDMLILHLKQLSSFWGVLYFDVNRMLEYKYIDNDHSVDSKSFGGTEPVSFLDFTGDTSGDDAGIDTGVTIGFRRMNVRLEQCELK